MLSSVVILRITPKSCAPRPSPQAPLAVALCPLMCGRFSRTRSRGRHTQNLDLLFTHTSVQNLNHGQDTNMVMIPVNTLAASTRLPLTLTLAAEAPYEATDLM